MVAARRYFSGRPVLATNAGVINELGASGRNARGRVLALRTPPARLQREGPLSIQRCQVPRGKQRSTIRPIPTWPSVPSAEGSTYAWNDLTFLVSSEQPEHCAFAAVLNLTKGQAEAAGPVPARSRGFRHACHPDRSDRTSPWTWRTTQRRDGGTGPCWPASP